MFPVSIDMAIVFEVLQGCDMVERGKKISSSYSLVHGSCVLAYKGIWVVYFSLRSYGSVGFRYIKLQSTLIET